jgi:YceI-like domain
MVRASLIRKNKMKTRTFISGNLTLLLLLAAWPAVAETMTTYTARSGSKMRLEGTSNIHDWISQGNLIGGHLDVGPGFPTEPGQAVKPGKIDAKAEAFVPVMSLKSIEKSGAPYSDAMDNVMCEHLKSTEFKKIVFHLTDFVLKEAPKDKESPYVFDTKGTLAVAGATNTISMPVSITFITNNFLKVVGTTTIKMSDYKVEPPAPPGLGILIKTADEVKVIFEWILAPKAPTPAK